MESKKSPRVLVDKFEKYEKEERIKKPKGGPEDDTNMIIESSEKIEIVQSFDELNLREELLRGVYAYGFDKPSAVQKRAILPIIKKRDVIVQS
jgi:ATP-dependent RNA helicase